MWAGNNLLFISFEQGGGGHKIGRVLSCLPNVYWYSHKDNGINPWNVHFTHTEIRQRHASKYHYDRLVPKGSLPPVHDYVKNFIPDEEYYYHKFFYPRFQSMGGFDIVKNQKLIMCTHSMPDTLLARFPKAKVINMIGDVDDVTDRYLQTSAIFPAFLKMKWLGGENTAYGKKLRMIAKEIGRDFTVRDIWAWDKHKTKFAEKYYMDYSQEIYNMIRANMKVRRKHRNEQTKVINSFRGPRWRELKEFINC